MVWVEPPGVLVRRILVDYCGGSVGSRPNEFPEAASYPAPSTPMQIGLPSPPLDQMSRRAPYATSAATEKGGDGRVIAMIRLLCTDAVDQRTA